MDNLSCIQVKVPRTATRNDWYMAVAYTVRDRMLHQWMQTIETYTINRSATCRQNSSSVRNSAAI
jgi:starch phosphorylase